MKEEPVTASLEATVSLMLNEDEQFAGFIIPARTGIVFSNQTCGTCCHTSSAEGVFVPLLRLFIDRGDSDPIGTLVDRRFEGWTHYDDFIEKYLDSAQVVSRRFEPVAKSHRDGLRLKIWGEAWVPLTVRQDFSDPGFSYNAFELYNLRGWSGFFTYSNSD